MRLIRLEKKSETCTISGRYGDESYEEEGRKLLSIGKLNRSSQSKSSRGGDTCKRVGRFRSFVGRERR